jgi:hypothetical protein
VAKKVFKIDQKAYNFGPKAYKIGQKAHNIGPKRFSIHSPKKMQSAVAA